ncbi:MULTISPECIES: hypothetical protein [unclassified Sphingomonas]|uniref:hypothetical protein n=1 Tax=unclassified Sphingomonas TaxID=196159 RepID=UPI0006F3BB86|nr:MULTISPECIES: hypothetical protein [unclassified Sphingomonas]KQX19344.1 hypothetical protein ASD17_12435 [Sphingomonas sp. Root1294]KQY65547.1 hypothetical protein ASD39_15635 [Sphingomonas sp. Root50]KRB95153.1 hypothetical protein ASE22_04425 [Sphingomonas sp. Root720]
MSGMMFGKPKMAAPTPVATRDMAAENAAASDEIRRRRGAGANVLLGFGGAEAATAGGKALLGV